MVFFLQVPPRGAVRASVPTPSRGRDLILSGDAWERLPDAPPGLAGTYGLQHPKIVAALSDPGRVHATVALERVAIYMRGAQAYVRHDFVFYCTKTGMPIMQTHLTDVAACAD